MKHEAYGYADKRIVTQAIDRATFEKVKKAKQTCLFALEIEEKFTLLFDNFAELEVDLLRLAEHSLIWMDSPREHGESMQDRLLLDRRIVNLLTSCRLYLDQSEHGLSMLFGNPSDRLRAFKESRRNLYDSHWGYRFMEALRNHVQHASLAAHTITHGGFLSSGAGSDYFEYTVYPQASARALLENPEFKRHVLDDCPQDREHIDLRTPIREYMSCFVSLHQKLRDMVAPFVASSRQDYESAVEEFAMIDEEQVTFAKLRECPDEGEVSDEVQLVTHFLGYYDDLFKRNAVNKDLQHSAASNTTQKRKYRPKT